MEDRLDDSRKNCKNWKASGSAGSADASEAAAKATSAGHGPTGTWVKVALREMLNAVGALNDAMGGLIAAFGPEFSQRDTPPFTTPTEAACRGRGPDATPSGDEPCGGDEGSGTGYEGVRRITVRDAARQILEKSAFEIPRDAIEFRKFGGEYGGDVGIEFRVVHYSDGPGVIRRSSESFVVCAEGGVYDVDGMAAQFDRNIEALSIVRFHRKSRHGHGSWDSL